MYMKNTQTVCTGSTASPSDQASPGMKEAGGSRRRKHAASLPGMCQMGWTLHSENITFHHRVVSSKRAICPLILSLKIALSSWTKPFRALQKRGLTSYQYNPNLTEEAIPSLLLPPVPVLQLTVGSLFNVQVKTWVFKIKRTFKDVCIGMYMRMCTRKYARLGSCVLQGHEGTLGFLQQKNLV